MGHPSAQNATWGSLIPTRKSKTKFRRDGWSLFPLLLVLFAFQACCVLASAPLRQNGAEVEVEVEEGTFALHGKQDSDGHDECRGMFDICCRVSSTNTNTNTEPTYYDSYPGQESLEYSTGSATGPSPFSDLLGDTMKAVNSLLALAVNAWCSRATVPPPHARPSRPDRPCKSTESWPGFSGLKHVFTFGDSYTTTTFDHTAEPFPTPENPLGNPAYPGFTSANGANWVDYLTVGYNQSSLLTYNLAVGGASVDSTVSGGLWYPRPGSLAYQVWYNFYTGYVQRQAPGAPDWHGNDTLFAIWIGINDINNSYERGPNGAGGTIALNRRIIAQYSALLEYLYKHGARNFVLLDVPALERSPLLAAKGEQAQWLIKEDVLDFNRRIRDMAVDMKEAHRKQVNVWYASTYKWFDAILSKPELAAPTANLKNLTDFCEGYQFGTPDEDTFKEECGVPVNQYFWLNSFHPTGPMHEVVADAVSYLLQTKQPNVGCVP